ncbi:histidinol-phosphate transaminase [Aquipuribacter nitratireducens]|uniref:Aromatic amino acid aminotransferase n=1 Tax=Aquipuribacter nitratireducens TaxID=650104 RepID=A0ABW0GT06_9MICO
MVDAVPRLRAALSALPAYRPGRAPSGGGGPAFKLSSNENPYPPLPSVLGVLADADRLVNRYPDMFATGLVHRIAARHGVAAEQVVCGTGSVGVLGQVVQATCEAGDEVVFAWRSFEAYPIVVGVSGATAVRVPLAPDGRHDLDAMVAAVTERTRLVLVCSPNNPTGPAVHREEMLDLLRRVPRDVVVVLDEAYAEFVRDPAAVEGPPLLEQHPNLVVLRTFSKAYGLAALRVGYALATPVVADALRATAVPFGVSGPAQAAALASLDAEDELLERVGDLVTERDRVRAALRGVGWEVPEPQGNFVWLALGDRTEEFVAACEAVGVTVRGFPGEGARCSIGEPEANDLLVRTAGGFAP